MRISELSAASGVPIATLKYYLREGMLERGEASSATRAEYGAPHLERVRLIEALTHVRGLSIAKVREIIAIIDGPQHEPVAALGHAVSALPPYPTSRAEPGGRAEHAARAAGFTFDPDYPAIGQLEAALDGLEQAGLPWDDDIARRYWTAVLPLAARELEPMQKMSREDSVAYAVLGTALYEPVILAMRRLAHRHLVEPPTDR